MAFAPESSWTAWPASMIVLITAYEPSLSGSFTHNKNMALPKTPTTKLKINGA
jgi:hypothetical protein